VESVILSVTALGSRDAQAAGAARAVVNYPDGRAVAPGGRRAGSLAEVPQAEGGGLVGYYADSVEGPGRWLGRGFAGLAPEGPVDPEQLCRVLLGQDFAPQSAWWSRSTLTTRVEPRRLVCSIPSFVKTPVIEERSFRSPIRSGTPMPGCKPTDRRPRLGCQQHLKRLVL
jgi:hypothetical protein